MTRKTASSRSPTRASNRRAVSEIFMKISFATEEIHDDKEKMKGNKETETKYLRVIQC
jgi:hypothetical protein